MLKIIFLSIFYIKYLRKCVEKIIIYDKIFIYVYYDLSYDIKKLKCCFMVLRKRILKIELYYIELYWIIKKFINYEIKANIRSYCFEVCKI